MAQLVEKFLAYYKIPEFDTLIDFSGHYLSSHFFITNNLSKTGLCGNFHLNSRRWFVLSGLYILHCVDSSVRRERER